MDTGNFYWRGYPLSEVYGILEVLAPFAKHTHLKGICDLPVTAPDKASWDDSIDVAFAATPDGVGMKLADDCLAEFAGAGA